MLKVLEFIIFAVDVFCSRERHVHVRVLKVTLATEQEMDWRRAKINTWSQSGVFYGNKMRDDGGLYETVAVGMEETKAFKNTQWIE